MFLVQYFVREFIKLVVINEFMVVVNVQVKGIIEILKDLEVGESEGESELKRENDIQSGLNFLKNYFKFESFKRIFNLVI